MDLQRPPPFTTINFVASFFDSQKAAYPEFSVCYNCKVTQEGACFTMRKDACPTYFI